jgi:hypothetical protein
MVIYSVVTLGIDILPNENRAIIHQLPLRQRSSAHRSDHSINARIINPKI